MIWKRHSHMFPDNSLPLFVSEIQFQGRNHKLLMIFLVKYSQALLYTFHKNKRLFCVYIWSPYNNDRIRFSCFSSGHSFFVIFDSYCRTQNLCLHSKILQHCFIYMKINSDFSMVAFDISNCYLSHHFHFDFGLILAHLNKLTANFGVYLCPRPRI